MKIDVEQLAEHLAHIPFQVQGVYRYAKSTGVPYAEYTDSFPGFVFPLNGKIQFQFNGTPYIFSPGKIVHGGANMKLDQKNLNMRTGNIFLFNTKYVTQSYKIPAFHSSILNY